MILFDDTSQLWSYVVKLWLIDDLISILKFLIPLFRMEFWSNRMNENAFILERKCFFISFYQFGGRLEATFAFEIRTYRQTIVNDNKTFLIQNWSD